MQKRSQYLFLFICFLLASTLLFFITKLPLFQPVQAVSEIVLRPVQNIVFSTFWFTQAAGENPEVSKLQDENAKLQKQLVTLKTISKENADLKAQLKNSPITPNTLVPAHIVGMRSFIPGFSIPSDVTLDVGKKEGVKEGMAVIVQDMLLGRIVKVSEHLSQLRLITSSQSTTTAKTLENDALGVIKGTGDGLLLDNVVLSDKLALGDTVITAGDENNDGLGFPPGLIIGKIVSLEKKPSALFQTAEVKSALVATKLHMVFVETQ